MSIFQMMEFVFSKGFDLPRVFEGFMGVRKDSSLESFGCCKFLEH